MSKERSSKLLELARGKMEWLVDRNKVWTMEMWLFEDRRALGIVATAKAHKILSGVLKKNMF